METERIFHLTNVEKKYNGRRALRVRSLELRRGERVLVSGANGTGKSTLLRIVAGASPIDSGMVERAPIWKSATTAYLPQEGGIYRDLTVRENCQVLCRLVGSRDAQRARVIADAMDLGAITDVKVDSLSGGHRRLAGLYCLLMSGAQIVILDEPFAALDNQKQAFLSQALKIVEPDLIFLMISEHLDANRGLADLTRYRIFDLDGHA